MSRRLGIVLSHPIQYYSPWFRWMVTHAAVPLRVFYLWDAGVKESHDSQFNAKFSWDVDLLSGYEHEFVPNTASRPGSDHFAGLKNPALTQRLQAWRPDVILIFGYKYHTHIRLILWARIKGIPLIFRGDSHLLGRGMMPLWKRLPLAILYRQFAAFICTGSANHDYYRAFGVSARRLFLAPHCVDSGHFKPQDTFTAQAVKLRESLGLRPDQRVVLFAGKFVPDKQPRELLAAFLALQLQDWAIVFVGDGAEKPALLKMAASAPPGIVHLLSFANQSEMPARYLMADLFVLPSRGFYETWGLAVNEAMHMGIPCLVSDRVGSQRDLVADGETGWVFKAGHSGSLQEKLSVAMTTLESSEACAQIKEAVAARISGYTYAQATRGLQEALTYTLMKP